MRHATSPRRPAGAQHSTVSRFVSLTLALAVSIAPALVQAGGSSADATDWVYRRSYFSHYTPPELAGHYPVPQSPSAYRPAVVSPYPGFGIQGISRFDRTVIQSGQSYDITYQRSNNVRVYP